MKNKLLLSMAAATVVTLSGCTTIADMAGADTATLNASASQSYNAMVNDARNKGQLDTSSATYKRINNVFNRLKPVANQMVLHLPHGYCFVSYGKKIAIKTWSGEVMLDEDYWDYSRTTSKYRREFLNEGTEETRKKIKMILLKINNSQMLKFLIIVFQIIMKKLTYI